MRKMNPHYITKGQHNNTNIAKRDTVALKQLFALQHFAKRDTTKLQQMSLSARNFSQLSKVSALPKFFIYSSSCCCSLASSHCSNVKRKELARVQIRKACHSHPIFQYDILPSHFSTTSSNLLLAKLILWRLNMYSYSNPDTCCLFHMLCSQNESSRLHKFNRSNIISVKACRQHIWSCSL